MRIRGWKKDLLRKGWEVARALEAVTHGQQVDLRQGLPDLGADLEAGLKRFLGTIERAIQRVSFDRFGRCAVCARPIAVPVLDERPWTERCLQHT